MLANVDPITLIKWDREENPPPREPDGKYSARDFGMWMMKYQTQKRGPGRVDNYPYAPPPKVSMSMPDPFKAAKDESKNEVEIRLKQAQAAKIEMENQMTAKTLIPVADIEHALAETISRVRSRFLKLPVALSPLILGDVDVYSIQQKLRDGVNDALAEMSVDWRSSGVEEAE